MMQDAIDELRAAAASLVTASAALKPGLAPAEISSLDAKDWLVRLLKEIGIKLIASDPT